MGEICNYNCTYCLLGKKKDTYIADCELFLKKIKMNLPGSWEFILSGGEPFFQPNFLQIVEKLIKMGHYISITTNFLAPFNVIKKFCQIADKRLISFAASMHLEKVDHVIFLEKAKKIREYINPGSIFVVLAVALKSEIKQLEIIGEKFSNEGIKFRLQPYKVDNNYFIDYSLKEKNS